MPIQIAGNRKYSWLENRNKSHSRMAITFDHYYKNMNECINGTTRYSLLVTQTVLSFYSFWFFFFLFLFRCFSNFERFQMDSRLPFSNQRNFYVNCVQCSYNMQSFWNVSNLISISWHQKHKTQTFILYSSFLIINGNNNCLCSSVFRLSVLYVNR